MNNRFSSATLVVSILLILILAGSVYAAGSQENSANSLSRVANIFDGIVGGNIVTGFAPLNPTPLAPAFSGYPSGMGAGQLIPEENIEFSFMIQNDDVVPHIITGVAFDGTAPPELIWTTTHPSIPVPGLTLNPGESAVLGYVSGNFMGVGFLPKTSNLQVTAIPAGMEIFPVSFFVLPGSNPLMSTDIPIDFGTVPQGAGVQTVSVNIENTLGAGTLVWNSDGGYITGGDDANFDIPQIPATLDAQIIAAGAFAPVDFEFDELGGGAGGYSSTLDNQLVSSFGNSNDPAGAGISLTAVVAFAPPASGEDIANAFVIPSLPYSDTGDTTTFVHDYDETCPYTGSTSPDVVYAYTPSTNEIIDIDLCPSSYDTKVYVYESSYTPGAPYACNDDDAVYCINYRSYLDDLSLTAGNTYYIVVDGYGGDAGPYVINIAVDTGTGSGDEEYPVQVDDNDSDDLYPAVDLARDGSDNVYVVFQSIRDSLATGRMPAETYPGTFEGVGLDDWNIYFANSSDHGMTWDIVQVTSDPSPDIFADIDVDPAGVIHVVWQSNRPDPGGFMYTDWHIYYKNSTDGGQTWGTTRFVGNQSLFGVDLTWDDINPAIVADNAGDLHIVWQSNINDTSGHNPLPGGSFSYVGLGASYVMGSWNWDIHYVKNSNRSLLDVTSPEIVENNSLNTDEFPDVEINATNVPHIVWHSAQLIPYGNLTIVPPNVYDIFAKDSSHNQNIGGSLGGSWSGPATPVSMLDPMNDMYPANAITSTGAIENVWQKLTNDPVPLPMHIYSEPCPSSLVPPFHISGWDIYYSDSIDGGVTWNPELPVDGMLMGWDAFPDIAVNLIDNLFAKWQKDLSFGAGISWEINESNSTPGMPWLPPWNVSNNMDSNDCHPQIIADNYSRNAWHSNRNEYIIGTWDIYYSEMLTVAPPVPVDCNCSSCAECEAKLNNTNCDVVNLTQDLSENDTCIFFPNVSNKVFDCQGHEIEMGGGAQLSPSAFHLTTGRNNNTIQNCSITNYWSGIMIGPSVYNNTLINNRIYGNTLGISAEIGSKGNLIYNNYFSNSGMGTENVIDWGNNSWNTSYGCLPGYSNIIGGNCTGGNFWDDYTGDDDGTGTLPGIPNVTDDGIGDTQVPYNHSGNISIGGDYLPLVYLTQPCLNISDVYLHGTDSGIANVYINEDTTLCSSGPFYNIPDPEQDGVLIINASNIFIDCANVTINGTDIGYGVYNYGYDNVTIKGCKIWNYRNGIHLDGTYNNTVYNNTVRYNSESGIALFFGTSLTNVLNNNATQNHKNGIFVSDSVSNTISGNNATSNGLNGIRIHLDSDYNNITNNKAHLNNIGILLDFESAYNDVRNNTVTSNAEAGIKVIDSSFPNVVDNYLSSNGMAEIYYDIVNGLSYSISNNSINAFNTAILLENSNDVYVFGNFLSGGGSVGLHYINSVDILTVNNYVAATISAIDAGNNDWNTTKTLGTNIIGGPYLGGNFWDDYNGTDTTADLLGDTYLPYASNITNPGDMHPLVYNASSCYNLSSVNDNYINNDSIAAPNVLICGYDYKINDSNNPGVIIINTSDISVTCWSGSGTPTTLTGNTSGYAIYNPGFDNVTIRNCDIFNYSEGIYWDGASEGVIEGNVLDYHGTGMHLLNYAEDNVIRSNIFKNNTFAGLRLDSFSKENNIENNYIDPSPYGIYMFQSYNNTIGQYNNISGNKVNIYMHNCFGNVVYRNYIQGATSSKGFELISSSENKIYDNYISGNSINAWDDNSNIWNLTQAPGQNILEHYVLNASAYGDVGGNYWSDYTGNDTDEDGIGETDVPWNSSGYIALTGDSLPLVMKAPTPDLIVVDISYNVLASPYTGDSLNITVTVKNNGTGIANNPTVQAKANATDLGTGIIATLAIGANDSINFTWTAIYGSHVIYGIADPSDTIHEMDETNNEMNLTGFGLFVRYCGDATCDPEENLLTGGAYCAVDCIQPAINSHNAMPDPVNQSFTINISANVTDLTDGGFAPGAVGNVWFEINSTLYPATGSSGDIWWTTGADTTVPGVNTYHVHANDTYGYYWGHPGGSFTVNIVPPIINWVIELPDPVNQGFITRIRTNVTDDTKLGNVTFSIDGGANQSPTSCVEPLPLPLSGELKICEYTNASTTVPGLHNYTVYADDEFGNPAVPVSGNFTVNIVPPVINWVNDVPDPILRNNIINISANITDDNGIAAVRFVVDGGVLQPPNGSNGSIYWYTEASTANVGTHTYSVQANDTFNNPAVPSNGTYQVMAPPTYASGGGAGPSSSGCEVRIEFNGDRKIYVDPGIEKIAHYEFLSLGCAMNDVYLTVEGIPSSWFTISPTIIDSIASGSSETFTIKVLAPTGTEYGSYSGSYVINAAGGYTFHNGLMVTVQAPEPVVPVKEKPAEPAPPAEKEPEIIKVAKGLFGMSGWLALAIGGILTALIVAILAVTVSRIHKKEEPEVPAYIPPAAAPKTNEFGELAEYVDKEDGNPVIKDAAQTEKEDN